VDLTQDDPEAKISRKHARIVVQDGEYYVEDVGSLNGTYINRGPRLMPGSPHVLKDGDEVVMGKTFFKFVAE
jgi:serine/threonine-protein kinase